MFVTGGAGYIGSHMVKLLAREGCDVTVFDNLSTGHSDAVRHARLVKGDLRDPRDIASAICARRYDLVMHFAACCYVGESMQDPGKYYVNNVMGTINLLEAMRTAGATNLVFSSTCATYGDPVSLPMTETHPQRPINPYGMSKFVAERAMADYVRAHGMGVISLRYFNAAGCDPDGDVGERHDPETHLIPLVLREGLRVRGGGRPEATALEVFGASFDTPDGTCVRDYIHVSDLCMAHLLAMRRLLNHGNRTLEAFNLGTERGHSVKEVIEACRQVTGQDIRYRLSDPRPGDPAQLVASAERARRELAWAPRYTELSDTIGTAWRWFSCQPALAGK